MSYEEEDTCMSYEEDTCMSYEEEETCMSYEEEDTCMSYEEEDTCMSHGRRIHAWLESEQAKDKEEVTTVLGSVHGHIHVLVYLSKVTN
jgi:hypothetical protein